MKLNIMSNLLRMIETEERFNDILDILNKKQQEENFWQDTENSKIVFTKIKITFKSGYSQIKVVRISELSK